MSMFQVGDVVVCVDRKYTDMPLSAGSRYSVIGVDAPPGFVMVSAVPNYWFVAERFKLARRAGDIAGLDWTNAIREVLGSFIGEVINDANKARLKRELQLATPGFVTFLPANELRGEIRVQIETRSRTYIGEITPARGAVAYPLPNATATHGKPLPDIARTPVADAIRALTGASVTLHDTGIQAVTKDYVDCFGPLSLSGGMECGPLSANNTAALLSKLHAAERKVIDTAVSAAKDGQWWKVNQAVRHLEWLEGKN